MKKKNDTANQSDNKKKLKSFLIFCFFGVLFLAILPTIVNNTVTRFPITEVKISGQYAHFDERKLKQDLTELVTVDFFSVDLDKIQKVVQETPWIDKAWVYKKWPGSILIKIEERVAVANWGKERLISQSNEIFTKAGNERLQNLPVFHGLDEHASVMANRYTEMRPLLASVGLDIKELVLEDRFSWKVTLSSGLRLVVDEADFMVKVRRFVALYNNMPVDDRQYIEQADLRYENGLAIKWKTKHGNSDAA